MPETRTPIKYRDICRYRNYRTLVPPLRMQQKYRGPEKCFTHDHRDVMKIKDCRSEEKTGDLACVFFLFFFQMSFKYKLNDSLNSWRCAIEKNCKFLTGRG